MSESNLEDRAAIHDLFTRYCCALDNGEIETVDLEYRERNRREVHGPHGQPYQDQ